MFAVVEPPKASTKLYKIKIESKIKSNIPSLYLKDRPHNLVTRTNGFHDHWNLSLGYYKNGYWFGPSLPKPTGFFSAKVLGSTSTESSNFPIFW